MHFLQCKNSIRRYLANDLTCAARKTTFRTRKCFHNKQYTPKSKDQPFESEHTHFDIGFNNGKQSVVGFIQIIFSTPVRHSLITNFTTNNPQSLNQNTLKTKHNKHNNPSHHTPRFLNIKIIAG